MRSGETTRLLPLRCCFGGIKRRNLNNIKNLKVWLQWENNQSFFLSVVNIIIYIDHLDQWSLLMRLWGRRSIHQYQRRWNGIILIICYRVALILPSIGGLVLLIEDFLILGSTHKFAEDVTARALRSVWSCIEKGRADFIAKHHWTSLSPPCGFVCIRFCCDFLLFLLLVGKIESDPAILLSTQYWSVGNLVDGFTLYDAWESDCFLCSSKWRRRPTSLLSVTSVTTSLSGHFGRDEQRLCCNPWRLQFHYWQASFETCFTYFFIITAVSRQLSGFHLRYEV